MVADTLARIVVLPLVALGWLYALLPFGGRRAFAWIVSRFFKVLDFRAQIIRANLNYAFPEDSTKVVEKKKQLFDEAYQHLGHLFFEVCMVLGPWGALKWYATHRVEMQGMEHWDAEYAKGQGVLFLSSHVGTWEIMAATSTILRKRPILIVTKRLKPAWFHKLIEDGRATCGVEGTYEPRTLSSVIRRIKEGGTVGVVLDQYAGPPVGVRVPLFGIPVGTGTFAATLSRRLGCPVLPVVNYRGKNGKLVIEIRSALPYSRSTQEPTPREIAQNTAQYVSILEKDILNHPDQWLWTHRRFKGDLSPLRPEEWDQRSRS